MEKSGNVYFVVVKIWIVKSLYGRMEVYKKSRWNNRYLMKSAIKLTEVCAVLVWWRLKSPRRILSSKCDSSFFCDKGQRVSSKCFELLQASADFVCPCLTLVLDCRANGWAAVELLVIALSTLITILRLRSLLVPKLVWHLPLTSVDHQNILRVLFFLFFPRWTELKMFSNLTVLRPSCLGIHQQPRRFTRISSGLWRPSLQIVRNFCFSFFLLFNQTQFFTTEKIENKFKMKMKKHKLNVQLFEKLRSLKSFQLSRS